MRRLFRLFSIFLRIGIMNEMQYRVNFWVQLMQSLISLGTGLVVLLLVYSYTDTLNGWVRYELLVVLGVYTLMGGFIRAFVEPNMGRLMEDVQQGTLDYTLTKPEDSQVLISVREFRVWQLVDVILGIIILGYALVQLQPVLGLWQALIFVVTMVMGGLMIYSVWLMITTGSFWFIRMGNLIEVFQSLYDAGRWPVGVYPEWLRTSLTFVVPVAFAVTVPAEVLTGRLTGLTLLGALGLTVLLMSLARWVWKFGLRNYTGASA
jgi:ABC-2 type transport system permease protein